MCSIQLKLLKPSNLFSFVCYYCSPIHILTFFSGLISGVLFGLFSGQPLILLGSTGPVYVFEKLMYEMCKENEWDYLSLRYVCKIALIKNYFTSICKYQMSPWIYISAISLLDFGLVFGWQSFFALWLHLTQVLTFVT